MIEQIETIEHVQQFAQDLLNEGTVFHPDDDFRDHIKGNNLPSFSRKEAEKRNRLMRQCFRVCKREEVDVYGVMLEIVSKHIQLN